MDNLKDKIYTFSVSNDDGSNRIEVTRTSGWEGLKPHDQLNMLKTLLLLETWGELQVKCIRQLEPGDLDELFPNGVNVLEEYEG